MRYSVAILLLLQATFAYSVEDDCSAHIFWQQGDIPVLLTAPHGASKHQVLANLPIRQGVYAGKPVKGFVRRADIKTDVIARQVAERLEQRGLRPFLLIAGIHRSQIDFNRPPAKAYESPLASKCYQYYHQKILHSIRQIRSRWQHGFLLDIHGQGRFSEQIIRGSRNLETLQALIHRYGRDVSEAKGGLYAELRSLGYNIQPPVGAKERYYKGGFTVKTYGSHQGVNGLDALQIEIGRDYRTNSQKRDHLIDHLTTAITSFYTMYYSVATTED